MHPRGQFGHVKKTMTSLVELLSIILGLGGDHEILSLHNIWPFLLDVEQSHCEPVHLIRVGGPRLS